MKGATLLPLNQGWHLLDGLVAEAQRNRERLDAHLQKSPPVGKIERPIIIAGAYRTGTTYLHRLLSGRFGYRPLVGWNSTIPTGGYTPMLVEDAQMGIDVLYKLQPELKNLHLEGALLPAECVRAMAMTGITGLWPAIAPCPEYIEFLMATDAVEAYKFYDQCLRTLDPTAKWLLKAPMHSLFLHDIAEVWPDALIVRIQRPLEEAVISATMFFAHLRALSQPERLEDHAQEVSKWIAPYLAEHDFRVDLSPLEVVNVSSFMLRTNPEYEIAAIKERLDADVLSR